MGQDSLRTVTVRRTKAGELVATNARGMELTVGGDDAFTPVELLLAAIGGCTGTDVATLTSRRAEPESFEVQVTADRVRDEGGNRLENIEVTFRARFPEGEHGDAARRVFPQMVARSHDRLCTVSRTIYLGTPITSRVDDSASG